MSDFGEGGDKCFELKPSSALRKIPSIDSDDNYNSDDSYSDDSPNTTSAEINDATNDIVGIPISIRPTIVPADKKLISHSTNQNNVQVKSFEINRAEVMLIKEIVPNLDTEVIFQILQKNKFDIELSIDASLALYATMEAEEGKILTNQKNNTFPKEDNVHDNKIPYIDSNSNNNIRLIHPSTLVGEPIRSVTQTHASTSNPGQSRRISISIDNSNLERNVTSAHLTQRGVPRLLPEDFLAVPRFKLTIDKKTDLFTEYSIQFRRTSEKLGITISEVDGEIVIYTLHTKPNGAPLLAQDAGVNVGDILIGINNDYFSQGAEVQDVLDVLGSTGSYVSLHLTRRHSNHSNMYADANEHRFAQILYEQQVVPVERMYNVGSSMIRLRDRVIQWSDVSYTVGGNNSKRAVLAGVDGHTVNTTNHNNTFDPFQLLTTGRSSFTVTSSRNSMTNNSRPLSFKTDTAIYSKNLRPGLSIRIMRAEERIDHVVYVVWVQDVKTSYEWVVRRRFREFNDFRDCLLGIKSSIGRFDFPPKRLSITETAVVVNERLQSLQKFIRKISSIACNNSSHPSTTRVQAALQYFLDVHDHIDDILVLEMTTTSPVRHMTQVFIHSVLQLSVMDKVLCGFIDNFIEESTKDNEVKWNDVEVRKVLSNVRDFIDNLQGVFSDGLNTDCVKIINKFISDEAISIKQLQDKVEQESLELVEGSNQHANNTKEANTLRLLIQQSIDRRERDLTFLANNPEEVSNIAKVAIRRQLEVEVYPPCVLRLSNLLCKVFHSSEQELQRKINLIYDQPQQFFGIPVKHTSPSNWSKVVNLLGAIRMKTLPFDRLELLLKVAKAIPLVFTEEHPGSEKLLGADEFLPIFIYVLVKSKIVDLLALNEELQAFCDPDKKLSETGYYMATLEASIQHILDADIDNGLGEVLFPSSSLAHTFTEDQWDDDTDSDDSVALENKESDVVRDGSPRKINLNDVKN